MSNADDHVLGKFMAEAILGKREVTWDPGSNKFGLIRVKITIKSKDTDCPIVAGFAPSGLHVLYFTASDAHLGFVCARKFFGT